MTMRLLVLLTWFLCGTLPASALELEGTAIQGGLIRGQVAPGSAVRLDGQGVRVDEGGRFIIGFGRDAGPAAFLSVLGPDGRLDERELEVASRRYEVQRVDGVPPSRVTPPPEVLERIRREHLQLLEVKRRDTALPHFRDPPIWPARGRISGIYGSQRIVNGKPSSPHLGVDIAAPRGTSIRAMASGVVSLAEDDLYFTGGTVMIDHGHGLKSIYVHMDTVGVGLGDELRRGAVIGAIGATGRATGPHLHWGIYWFDRPLDPLLLVGPMPAS